MSHLVAWRPATAGRQAFMGATVTRHLLSATGYRGPSIGVVLSSLVLACTLLAAGRPALGADEQTAYKSFQEFSRQWMARLAEISDQNSRKARPSRGATDEQARYVCYGPDCEIWIKKTDSRQTPYVGFIRYPEKHFLKNGDRVEQTDAGDTLLTTFPVTEIFRFSAGRWIY